MIRWAGNWQPWDVDGDLTIPLVPDWGRDKPLNSSRSWTVLKGNVTRQAVESRFLI